MEELLPEPVSSFLTVSLEYVTVVGTLNSIVPFCPLFPRCTSHSGFYRNGARKKTELNFESKRSCKLLYSACEYFRTGKNTIDISEFPFTREKKGNYSPSVLY